MVSGPLLVTQIKLNMDGSMRSEFKTNLPEGSWNLL